MRTKKYTATLALMISIIGAGFFYPYHLSFVGGLMYHGCLAAMIGGLADWFAVTALFRKPLGISYRTAIIPRNRQRIFNELVEFVGNDLLSPSNIIKVIRKYDTSDMLVKYLEENDGKTKLKVLIKRLSYAILENLDTDEIGKRTESIVRDGSKDVTLAPMIKRSLLWSIERHYDETIVNFILDEMISIVRREEMKKNLAAMIEKVKIDYEENNKRRQLVRFVLAISSHYLAAAVQKEIIVYLESLHNREHKIRLQLKEWLKNWVENSFDDDEFLDRVNAYQYRLITEKLHINEKVSVYMKHRIQQSETDALSNNFPQIEHFIDEKVAILKEDAKQQQILDKKLKAYLSIVIRKQHKMVIKIVQERLQEFSNDDLALFIEHKVGEDLQMIRVNGALIGGVVGMILYGITYAAERIWC